MTPDQLPQSRPQALARLEIPITPEMQAAMHQTAGCSGRRKRRSRGGRGGGATGAGGNTLRGSLPSTSSSFSRSGCANFAPQPQKKRNNNN
ncbi:hypothetical protein TSMEX_007541 [Taenia solium]|eukprot:TsM_000564000 transcript=TsM_000564000 gene=TsM_000564000